MRVCDRHMDRPARDTIIISAEDERFDLCDECKSDLLMFLTSEARAPESAVAEKSAPILERIFKR